MLLAQGAQERYGTPGLDAHTAPAGPFRHTFNPYVSPFAAHAKILHFNGDVGARRPSQLREDDASRRWRRGGTSSQHAVAAMASRRAYSDSRRRDSSIEGRLVKTRDAS